MGSREQELRERWELKAKQSYSDIIGSAASNSSGGGGRGHGGGHGHGGGSQQQYQRPYNPPKWKPGKFPHIPSRFKLGSKHNTPFNNNLFYEARIVSENTRIGVPQKHARKPSIFDSKSPPPKTGREREHKAFRYGMKESFAYIKKKHERVQPGSDTAKRTQDKLERLEDMLRQSQEQRRDLDKKFDVVLGHIIDGIKPRASQRKRLSLQEQIERRKRQNARRRGGSRLRQ